MDNPDSKFYRVIYSTNHISLNSVGFVMHLNPTKHAQSIYCNKLLVSYDIAHPTNTGIISQLRKIEYAILDKFVHSVLGESRRAVYSLAEYLNTGCIKAYSHHHHDAEYSSDYGNGHGQSGHGHGYGYAADDETTDACDPCVSNGLQLIVTIFGLWETQTECGLVYKFMKW